MPLGSTEASLAETLRPSQHPSLSSQDRQGKHSAFHLERESKLAVRSLERPLNYSYSQHFICTISSCTERPGDHIYEL